MNTAITVQSLDAGAYGHTPLRYKVTITAPDFLGLLSIITGLFSSYGLVIHKGQIGTIHKRAIDSFEVETSKTVDWKLFEKDFRRFTEKAYCGGLDEVRLEMNRRIIRYLRSLKEIPKGQLEAITLHVDQSASPAETVVDIRAQDTPAFLYELTNGLALLGINIVKMEIDTAGHQVQDRLWVTTESGQKITDEKKLKALQWAILLMKQFTHLLPSVPDPKAALEQITLFGRDLFERPDFTQILLTLRKSHILKDLSRIFGTSRFLWEEFIRTQHESIFPILADQKFLKIKKDRSGMVKELSRFLNPRKNFEEKIQALNEYKDREMFRIDLRHILGKASYLGEFAEEFTDLAEAVVEIACDLVWEELTSSSPHDFRRGSPTCLARHRLASSFGDDTLPVPSEMSVLALGKFGGRELGYASDLELLFVYSDDPDSAGPRTQKNLTFYNEFVRTFTKVIQARSEGVFEIDLRLRPYGKNGPPAVSINLFKKYYTREGDSWNFERQALVKLRPIAGSKAFAEEIMKVRDEFVYGDYPFDFREAIHLRTRQRRELVPEGTLNAKYSAGGLLDVEFLIQILQIVFGRRAIGDVRHPNTLKAMRALWEMGAVPEKEFQALRASYIFLRSLINALRIVRGNAKDLAIPDPASEEFVILGRRMGYAGDDATVRLKFQGLCRHHRAVAERLYESRMQQFLEEEWSVWASRIVKPAKILRVSLDDLLRGELSSEQIKTLTLLGFQYPTELVHRLRRLGASAQLFEPFAQMVDRSWPLWPKIPDPDMAMLHLERFIEAYPDKENFYESILQTQRPLSILLTLFGTSRYLSELLIMNPEYWKWVQDERRLSLDHTEQILKHEREQTLDWNGLRRLRYRETLRVALAELFSFAPLGRVHRIYTQLADFVLEKVLAFLSLRAEGEAISDLRAGRAGIASPAVNHCQARNDKREGICVLGLGKLGAQELNFSSDIDLMFISDEKQLDPQILPLFLRHLREGALDEFLYRVDLRLRPHGDSGKLWLDLAEYLHYYEKEAEPWEFQMLIKARPVAGNLELGRTLLEKLQPLVFRKTWSSDALENIRTIKRRYEALVRSRDEWETNVKMGPGGIRDVEFAVQFLQLLHGYQFPGLRRANHLEALHEVQIKKLLPEKECETLREAYVFLRRIENRLQLFDNRQVFNIPRHELGLRILAKSLGIFDEGNNRAEDRFLAEFNRTRRSVRPIFERVFYQSSE